MPVIEIGVNVPGQGQAAEILTAVVDSGSDGTLIPIDILEKIKARYVGDGRIRGILGNSQPVQIYLISLHVGSHLIPAARVVAVSEGDETLLGRNVLNELVITLNGPASVTEVPA